MESDIFHSIFGFRGVTYFSSHFHLTHFIYQSPSHLYRHSFPPHSFYWFIFLIVHLIYHYIHTTSLFNLLAFFHFPLALFTFLSLSLFKFYLTATENDCKNDKIKTLVLLSCIGQKVREIYETFRFYNNGDEMKLAPVLEKFSNTATNESTSLYVAIRFLFIDNMKGRTSMSSLQNWKNLVQNVNLKLSVIL